MKAFNSTRQTFLSDQVVFAVTPFSRMKGLLGRNSLEEGESLLISACNSIHMVFMRFSIDVVFLDHQDRVVGLVKNIPPFAFSPVFWKASKALELPAGTIERSDTQIQDFIEFRA